MKLTINGAERQVPMPLNVTQLLEDMQLTGKRVAVERNGEIVPRSQYFAVELIHGDQLEIVVAVGGG
jgi:sulfur carrier protein